MNAAKPADTVDEQLQFLLRATDIEAEKVIDTMCAEAPGISREQMIALVTQLHPMSDCGWRHWSKRPGGQRPEYLKPVVKGTP